MLSIYQKSASAARSALPRCPVVVTRGVRSKAHVLPSGANARPFPPTARSAYTPSRPLSVAATASAQAPSTKVPPAEPWKRHISPDSATPTVYTFFEKATSTWQYIVVDPHTREAVIVDPVLDYDANAGAISTQTADGLLAFVEVEGLKVRRILYVPSPLVNTSR